MITVYLLGLFTYSYHKYFTETSQTNVEQADKLLKTSFNGSKYEKTLHLNKYFKLKGSSNYGFSITNLYVVIFSNKTQYCRYNEGYISIFEHSSQKQRPPPVV